MAFVGATRLRVRSIRFLPSFALHFVRTVWQVKAAQGFQGGAVLADRGWAFWTVTMWDSRESMRRYMTGGAHRVVMPFLLDWCDEASVAEWDQAGDDLPSWADAERLMRESGRPSKVRLPSPRHAAMSFPAPRVSVTMGIAPARR